MVLALGVPWVPYGNGGPLKRPLRDNESNASFKPKIESENDDDNRVLMVV